MDWLIRFTWDKNSANRRDPEDLGWLQGLVVSHLIDQPGSLDRCRAMVLNHRYDPRTRGRLAMHLVRNGTQSDLTRLRTLALDNRIDIRAREIILDRLLQRREPDDLVALVDAALQPRNSRLARMVVRNLLAVGEHHAVRRLWLAMWNDGYDCQTRLAIGETLAYVDGPADHDEMRRVISTAMIRPAMRLRLAEILSHRGDGLAREVLRNLACDGTLDMGTRAEALALIAVPREAADVHAIRRVALDYFAPGDAVALAPPAARPPLNLFQHG